MRKIPVERRGDKFIAKVDIPDMNTLPGVAQDLLDAFDVLPQGVTSMILDGPELFWALERLGLGALTNRVKTLTLTIPAADDA